MTTLAPRSGPTPKWREATIRPGAIRLVQVQIFAVYFYAALHKHVEGFADGYPLCASFWRYFRTSRIASWLQADEPAFPRVLGWITDDPGALLVAIEAATERVACQAEIVPLLVYASVATIVVEYLLAFGLLFRRVNYVVAVLGVGMHGFIFFGMNVETFGTLMVGSYFIFFGAPPAGVLVDGWRGDPTDAGPGTRPGDTTGAGARPAESDAAPPDPEAAPEPGDEKAATEPAGDPKASPRSSGRRAKKGRRRDRS